MFGAPLLAGALYAGATAPESAVQNLEQGVQGLTGALRGSNDYDDDSSGWQS